MANDQQKRLLPDHCRSSLSLPVSILNHPTTELAAAWLKWLVHTTAVASADCVAHDRRLFSEPMVLGMPMTLDSTTATTTDGPERQCRSTVVTAAYVHSNQGTEEASRASPSIPSTGSRNQHHSNSTKTHGYDTQQQHQQQHQPDFAVQDESSIPEPQDEINNPSSSVFSRAATLSSAKVASRNQDSDRSVSSSSASAPISSSSSSPSSSSPSGSSGTGSSSLLLSANQEFYEAWTWTTAFLNRTFSPTYRVSSLYIDSWTNGTQRRGLEKMRASLLRGDAWTLVKGMTKELQNRWRQSIADSEARIKDLERRAKSLEDVKRLSNRGGNHGSRKENSHPSDRGNDKSGISKGSNSSGATASKTSTGNHNPKED